MKWIILFPFLPMKWAWQWSGGTTISSGSGESSGFFAHLIGFLIVAGILYGAIGWGVMKVLSLCGVGA